LARCEALKIELSVAAGSGLITYFKNLKLLPMKNFAENVPVLVVWEDHFVGDSSWHGLDSVSLEPQLCTSVGWIVKEDKEHIVLMPHLSPVRGGTQSGFGELTIVRAAIRAKKFLCPRKK
jgi:hypothetical protein